MKTFFDFWKENVFKFNNEQHVILNLIYNKYNLNVIKLSYLDSKVLFLNNKSNFLKKSKKNSNFITNTDRFYINKFSMYFNKKKVFKKVKKSKKIPDPLFFKSLNLINSNNLKLVFYFYIFSYIKKIYNISINFLFNIEFLYLKKK